MSGWGTPICYPEIRIRTGGRSVHLSLLLVKKPPLPKHCKVLGELAEAMFVARALRLGFRVSRPFGESAPYDFVVEKNGVLRRVQLKSASRARRDGFYRLSAIVCHSRPYTARDTDFLVGYIFPADTWYIVPVSELRVCVFNVRCAGHGRFERFREAWPLLWQP